jgi:hypothetical protein
MITCVGVAEGQKCVAKAREATHEYVDSPMEIHEGEDDQSEAAVSDEASPKEAKAT